MTDITKPDSMRQEEAAKYVEHLEKKYNRPLKSLVIELDKDDPDFVGLTYVFEDVPFERIRRITGYLVGTMDNWNDAKASEEGDRVKHGMGSM